MRRTATLSALFAAAMVALAFASVPLYRMFCQATGFGGTTQRVSEADAVAAARSLPAASGRTVSIRFDSNTAPDLPWDFSPVQRRETVAIGERRLAFFRATNTSDRAVTGTAVFNVSPDTAGPYFVKIACFCFTQQRLEPHETVDMPVTFYIDPGFLGDRDAAKVEEITLSYTFYPSAPAEPAEQNASQKTASTQAATGRTAPQVQG